MKKLFYMLCMSALIFTGCKKSSPTTEDISAAITHTFCTDHPTDRFCLLISGKTELSLEDVKPVTKLQASSTEMLRGASDPIGWAKGYDNMTINDSYISNFSVEAGSVLTAGMALDLWNIDLTLTYSFHLPPGSTVSATVGGDRTIGLSDAKIGTTVRVAILEDMGAYFYLPPYHFTK